MRIKDETKNAMGPAGCYCTLLKKRLHRKKIASSNKQRKTMGPAGFEPATFSISKTKSFWNKPYSLRQGNATK